MSYNGDTSYQTYFANLDGNLQNFILNGLICAAYNAMQNESHKSMFEFNYDYLVYNNNAPTLSTNNWNGAFNEFKNYCPQFSKKAESIFIDIQTTTTTIVFVVEYKPNA